METKELAHKLITASRAVRQNVLRAGDAISKARIATEIRKECVAAWTSDPKRVRACVDAISDLEKISNDPIVRAEAEWTRGIAAITRGRFERAVVHLKSAGDIFTSNNQNLVAADSRVALLLALAMLGRYDEAIATGRSAIPILVKSGDDLAAGKVEMNLSNIVARRGDHAAAAKYCTSARDRFKKAKERKWQAMAENGLANTAAEQNDFEKAERFYRAALRTAKSGEMHVTEAEIVASMGNLALFRGRYADALRHLEISRRQFTSLAMPHQSAIAELEIADIYGELNLHAEAAEIYVRVCPRLRKLKLRAEEARSRLNYAKSLSAIGEVELAATELETAAKLYTAEKNDAGVAAAMLAGSRLSLVREDYKTALSMIAEARKFAAKAQDTRLRTAIELRLAEIYIAKRSTKKARPILEKLLDESQRLGLSDAVRSALNLLGRAALDDGDSSTAVRHFRESIRITERLRAPLASEEFSMPFLAARLEPFENLARVYVDAGKISEAFETIERARSRALVDALHTDSSATSSDPQLAELTRIREELNSYYKRLDRADDDDVAHLRTAANELESRIAKLTREIASLLRAGKKRPVKFSRLALQRQLGKSAALVEYVEIDGHISAFRVDSDGISFVRDLAPVVEIASLLSDLRFQFETLRYGASLPKQFLDQIRKRTDDILRRLHDRLIAPLGLKSEKGRLVIVPVGLLHYVPFAALQVGGSYLVEQFEIATAPSAAVWSSLAKRPRREIESSLLIGFADEKIPLVNSEIAALKRIVPAVKTLNGSNATLRAFSKYAPGRDLIHLACHGEFRGDNPMFSSLHLADGWITVRDLVDQRLDAELVTLSACETGINSVNAGDELLGLTRGFLSAGAASVIVTLWRVNDEAAMRLMGDLYEEVQRGAGPAASLRFAQKIAIRRGMSPYYWAPFVYTGR